MLGTALLRAFSDALQVVGGMSVLGGVVAWAVVHVGRFVDGKDRSLDRWMLNGAGGGGAAGILAVLLDFLL